MQVIVNDLVVSYTKSGQGPVMVLLHGWGDTARTFDALVSQLEPNFTLVRFDLAGFGGSQPPHKDWGLNDYAQYVRDVLQKIAIMPNDITVLLGHSNGGAIAIEAVAKGYVRPKKLILLASAGIRNTDSVRKTTLKLLAKSGKVATAFLPKSAKHSLRKKFYDSTGSDLLVAEHMQGTFKKIVKQDVLHQAEKITLPTLLLYGELDTATPPTYGQLFQNTIQSAHLTVIQNADHFLHQNHTDEVSAYIKRFMA